MGHANEHKKLKVKKVRVLIFFFSNYVNQFHWAVYIYVAVIHCVKMACIQNSSGQYFPTFGLNRERYSYISPYSVQIRENRDQKTPDTDTSRSHVNV